MSSYLILASYAPSAIANMVKNPQDRALPVASMLESIGGKLQGLWFAMGENDVVAICDLPSNVDAAALSMAIGSSGAMASFRTIPLISSREGMDAMKKAGAIAYPAPR